VREVSLAFFVSSNPFVEDGLLDATHRFHLGNAGVGHAVHVTIEKLLLVLGSQVAIVRHPLVMIVSYEVEDVFLEVCARAGNRLHLVLPDHLSQ
jgi:hypothetical protein